MALIYKITNQQTGKVYIGKTTHATIEERWKEHLRDYKRPRCKKRPLYNSMNFYGPEVFTIEQVEECPVENLSEREIYWIAQYDSYYNGYNGTKGGDGKIYLDYPKIIELYQEYQNIKKVARIYGCHPDSVKSILKTNHIPIKTTSEVNKKMFSKKVGQYDKDKNILLNTFDSTRQAGEYLVQNNYTSSTDPKGVAGHISHVCTGKRKAAYGFNWKYIEE